MVIMNLNSNIQSKTLKFLRLLYFFVLLFLLNWLTSYVKLLYKL